MNRRDKKYLDQLEEAERADRESAERHRAQRECSHYSAQPTEWWWNGRIRNMHCNICGLDEFRDEEDL